MREYAPKHKRSQPPSMRPPMRTPQLNPDRRLGPGPQGFGHDFSRIPLRAHSPVTIQAKSISAPGGIHEEEADRLAEQVMNMPSPRQQAGEQLPTKPVHERDPGVIAVPPVVHEVLRSSGQPLDTTTRGFMESRFGRDFTHVRVHTGARAAEAAAAIDARAFTLSRDIVFGTGEYAPQTDSGRRILSHELTHVVQQGAGVPLKDRVNEAGDHRKQPALTMAETVACRGSTQGSLDQQEDLPGSHQAVRTADIAGARQGLRASILGIGSVQPKIQRQQDKRVPGELKGEEVVAALDSADVEYLLEQHFARNILRDLSIHFPKRRESRRECLTVMQAGALAFTLGMLKQRNDYKKLKKAASTAYKTKATPKKTPDLIDTVDPDKTVGPYVPADQVQIVASLKKEAQPFFDAMLKIGWVKPEAGMLAGDMQMPDQRLAAVGDLRGESAGIAGGRKVAVGYFMYSDETPPTAPTKTNTLNIDFPAEGSLKVRMSAYGFDPTKQSTSGVLVRIMTKGAKIPLANVRFEREEGKRKSTQVGVSDKAADITIEEGEAAATVIIPAKPYKADAKGIIFKVESHTSDEVQVQFSTTGGIAENKIPEDTSVEENKNKAVEKTVTTEDKNKPVLEYDELAIEYDTSREEYRLKDIYFDSDKADLKEASYKSLENLLQILNSHSTMIIEIAGHTDSDNTDDYNQALSQRRTEAVVKYLTDHNIGPARLKAKGYGERDPISTNDTEEGKARNRRVVFRVLAE